MSRRDKILKKLKKVYVSRVLELLEELSLIDKE